MDKHKAHSGGHNKGHKVHKKNKVKIKPVLVWQIATIILAVALILVVTKPGMSGSISKDAAAESTIEFVSDVLLEGTKTANLEGVEMESNLYKVDFEIEGQSYPSYVSTDGKLLFLQAIEMEKVRAEAEGQNQQAAQEAAGVEKTAVPEVELYIFSYCPAGSSALDAFAPVGLMLKDVADFKVRFFSDMHGPYEKQQNLIQSCIQDVDADKFWNYADVFFEEIYTVCGPGRDIDCDKEKSIELMGSLGIDSDAVMACVDEKGEDLYSADKAKANELQLRYSPSFVVNGQYLSNVQRSPEGIKSVVCSAFTDAPESCAEALSEQAQSAGSC